MRRFGINRMKKAKQGKLPFIILFVLVTTIIACTVGSGIVVFGFAVQGYIWFFTLIFSLFALLPSFKRVSFPWFLWLPWAMLLMIYLVFSDYENALQRTVMMICPIIVGMAVSTLVIRKDELENFSNLCKKATKVFFVFVLISTGMLFTGTLPPISGLAPQVMTGALLATLFVARYVFKRNKESLYYWLALAAVPFIGLTRMGIAATMATFPLTLAPLKIVKRVIIVLLVAVVGVGMFYTERVQKKMFYSGEGTLGDISLDNPDFYTTGRAMMWELMEEEAKKELWFGFGANANEAFIVAATGLQGQPHNDWLRLRFDYGYAGTFIFALCMFFQLIHAWRMARKTDGETRILFYAGASSFIPVAMFMVTDNIVLYCQFFGNLQFTILGLAYASTRTLKDDAKRQKTATQQPPQHFREDLYFNSRNPFSKNQVNK